MLNFPANLACDIMVFAHESGLQGVQIATTGSRCLVRCQTDNDAMLIKLRF